MLHLKSKQKAFKFFKQNCIENNKNIKKIVLEIRTRWNSQFLMFTFFLEYKTEINKYLYE